MPVSYRYITIQDSSVETPWVGFSDNLARVGDWDELRDVLMGISLERVRRESISLKELQNSIVIYVLERDDSHKFPGRFEELKGVIDRLYEDHGARRALQIFYDAREARREIACRRDEYFLQHRKYKSFFQRMKAKFLGKSYGDPDDHEVVQNAYRTYLALLQEQKKVKELL